MKENRAQIELRQVNIEELQEAPYNPREMDEEEFEKLKRSLAEFGYVDPIIVNKRTMHIVGGNQRYRALKELGIKYADVVFVDLDEKKEKALNIALNKIQGNWDFPKLKEVLAELDQDLWELTGFDLADINDLLNDFIVQEPPDTFETQEESTELVCRVYYTMDRKTELEQLLQKAGFKYQL